MVLLIGALIGLVLGLTGAGGSVFAVPLLVLAFDLTLSQAAGLSLGAVSIAALIGVLMRLASKDIQWLPALIFAVVGALVAPVGGLISEVLSSTVLVISFNILVALVALRMWRQAVQSPEMAAAVRAGSSASSPEASVPLCGEGALSLSNFRFACFIRVVAAAALTGLLSGIFGVGGGFVIVPVLVTLLRMDIRMAVSTSLFVIFVVSTSGFTSYVMRAEPDMALLSGLAMGGSVGMALGILISKWIAGPVLQKVFAVMMPVMAFVMALGELLP